MKVVCVDDRPGHANVSLPNGSVIKGEAYTVAASRLDEIGQWGYELVEKPILTSGGVSWQWKATRFVPLSYFEAEFAVKETEPEPCPNC